MGEGEPEPRAPIPPGSNRAVAAPAAAPAGRSQPQRTARPGSASAVLYPVGGSPGIMSQMTVPATSRQSRMFEDRADALVHFFLRAGEAPRLLAYYDACGCLLDQALAAVACTAALGIL